MDAKLKAKWLKALRSGKYKQTRGKLLNERTGGMCCIAVGARVADKKFNLHTSTYQAAQRIGLSTSEQGDLVDLNDYERKNFKSIANWIEANL